MLLLFLPFLFAIIDSLTVGCKRNNCPPCHLAYIYRVELTANSAKIIWHEDAASMALSTFGCSRRKSDFGGYNIYAFLDSAYYDLSGDNDSLANYLIKSIAGHDTVAELSLDPNKAWFVQVRVFDTLGNVGDYTMEKPYVPVSPRPYGKGIKVFGKSQNTNSNSCFVFSTGEVLDTTNFAKADFFLDVSQSAIGYIGQIVSPWVRNISYKRTKLKIFGRISDEIEAQIEIADAAWSSDSTGVQAKKGWTYAFKCTDTTFAKIKIDSVYIDSVNLERSFIIFDYAWQNVKHFRFL